MTSTETEREAVQPLSAAETEYVHLVTRLRDEAIAHAEADYRQRLGVFHRQYGIPATTTLVFAPAVGPIPARCIYTLPPTQTSDGTE